MGASPQIKKAEERFEPKFAFRCEEEAGASLAHNQINRNLLGLFWRDFRGSCCQPFASDLPVYSKETKRIYLPDIVVVCDTPLVEPCEVDIKVQKSEGETKEWIKKALTNPFLLAEVWSEGNTDDEKTKKRTHYQQIESLQHYLEIEQMVPKIVHHYRNGENNWASSTKADLTEQITLNFVSCDLSFPLREIYELVF